MSRIGKQPIEIPVGVEIKIDGQKVSIKGPKGELVFVVPKIIKIEIIENKIKLSPVKETQDSSALWGTARAILASNVKGVTDGYTKQLKIEGLGYKADVSDKILTLNVGFSHPVKFTEEENIAFSVEKDVITVSGIDKQRVAEIAAQIRKTKIPDPYKAKGIRYINEIIKKKPGKKVVAAAGAK